MFSVILAIVVLFFVLGYISKSGEASGLVEGKLSKCPDKNNCVCSEYKNDTRHYIDPLLISEIITPPAIRKIIEQTGGTIVSANETYIAATFTSAIFRFVDDVEIRFDAANRLMHIRSASRVGHGDSGVNKKRVEKLKTLFEKQITKLNPD